MEKLLLLMPKFMGYEQCVITNLQKKYEVTWVNSDQFDKQILEDYKKCSKLRWGLRHLFSVIKEWDQESCEKKFLNREFEQINLKENYYSTVFCINGSFLADAFYMKLKENNPKAKFIYYAWDDVKNLIKNSHISFFDRVYSYNIEECQNYGWTYVPMFVQSEIGGHAESDEYDIMFIGSAHSDRRKIANKLVDLYSEKYKLFIYLYDSTGKKDNFCHNVPLSYEQYFDIMRRSKVILDVPHVTQEGPTTRSFDALLTETKVITVNSHMKKYPIYSENMLIVDRNDIVIDDEFMNKPYQEIGYEALTISKWLLEFGL